MEESLTVDLEANYTHGRVKFIVCKQARISWRGTWSKSLYIFESVRKEIKADYEHSSLYRLTGTSKRNPYLPFDRNYTVLNMEQVTLVSLTPAAVYFSVACFESETWLAKDRERQDHLVSATTKQSCLTWVMWIHQCLS